MDSEGTKPESKVAEVTNDGQMEDTNSAPVDANTDSNLEQAASETPESSVSTVEAALDSDSPQTDSSLHETVVSSDDSALDLDDPKATELSSDFVGRWSELISTTNWEKGKIIHEWRETLMGNEAPVASYSDEAWSRRVGGVTPQHVGRLRRVFDRFGAEYGSYQGLYWSHFLAALDWDDAEMWLEGASRSKWSVSQMRRTRWESSGSDPSSEPNENDVVAVTHDEDYEPLAEVDGEAGVQDGSRSVAEGPRAEDPDFGDEPDGDFSPADGENLADDDSLPWEDDSTPPDSPFANLPSLPTDFADALEQFKLAIIRHRADDWSEVEQTDVIKAIDALRVFATR